MSNIITASVKFYFKGEKYTPALTIELDTYMQSSGYVPELYGLIAKINNIDLYSYEFEMMMAEQIMITDAQGLVKEYIENNILDIKGFESAWEDHRALKNIQSIAEKNMGSDCLRQYPGLRETLLEVYESGKKIFRQ